MRVVVWDGDEECVSVEEAVRGWGYIPCTPGQTHVPTMLGEHVSRKHTLSKLLAGEGQGVDALSGTRTTVTVCIRTNNGFYAQCRSPAVQHLHSRAEPHTRSGEFTEEESLFPEGLQHTIPALYCIRI